MLLFCVKTNVKESHTIELAHLKEKKKKKEKKGKKLAVWRLSGSILLQCFFVPLGMLFIMQTLKDERYIVLKACKLAFFKIL